MKNFTQKKFLVLILISGHLSYAMQDQYVNVLKEYRLEAATPIQDIAADQLLWQKTIDILMQPQFFSQTYDRAFLLQTNLERPVPNGPFSIDIQGKKLIGLLRSGLIFHLDLLPVIEKSIQEYCTKAYERMSHKEHILFNSNIFELSKTYTDAAITQQATNNTLFHDFFNTRKILDTALSQIGSYYNYLENKAKQTQTTQTEPVTVAEPDSELEPVAVAEENHTDTVVIIESPKKIHLTKKQRAEQKKRELTATKEQAKTQIIAPAPIEPDTNTAPKIQEKTREAIKLEYLKQEQANIRNYERFFSFAKDCYASDETRQDTIDIIQKLADRSTDMTVLLYITKFQMHSGESPELLIYLFDNAITENKIYDLIDEIIKTGTYTELIKWINNSDKRSVEIYITEFINFFGTRMAPSITKDTNLSQESKNKYASCYIKLLHNIVQKIKNKTLALDLINFCTYFGYDDLENFIIKPDELLQHIKEYVDTPDRYYTIIDRLINKKKKNAKNFALECCILCAETFSDIESMYKICDIYQEEKREDRIKMFEYWTRKIIELDPADKIAKYRLAIILYFKKRTMPIDIYEIINLLKDDQSQEAQLIRAITSRDPQLRAMINYDPDELIRLVENAILNDFENSDAPRNSIPMLRSEVIHELIQSLLLSFCDHVTLNTEQTKHALEKYYDPKSELSEQERQDLKHTIYQYFLFNKYDGWSKRFARLQSAIKTISPDTTLEEYLKTIDDDMAENHAKYICKIIEYTPELKEQMDTYSLDSYGNTILHYLAACPIPHIIRFVLEDHPQLLSIKNRLGESAITEWAMVENSEDTIIDTIQALRKINPNITNEPDNKGDLPIHVTAKYGKCKVFGYLIKECGANPRSRNLVGYDVLTVAIENDKHCIIDYMDTNNIYNLDVSAYIYACTVKNRPDIVEQASGRINIRSGKDMVMIHNTIIYALQTGLTQIVNILVNKFTAPICQTLGIPAPIILVQDYINIANKFKENATDEKLAQFELIIKELNKYRKKQVRTGKRS